jgi:hypothetical protein
MGHFYRWGEEIRGRCMAVCAGPDISQGIIHRNRSGVAVHATRRVGDETRTTLLSVATTYEHIAESVERDVGKGRLPDPTGKPKGAAEDGSRTFDPSLSSGSASDFVASHILQSLIDCPQPQDLLSA